MRAREWTVAANFRTPADYGIPELPAWRSHRDDGGVAFVAADADADGEPDAEPFIAAENPITVRR